MHQPSVCSILVLRYVVQLARLLNHFLRNHLERSFISINDLQDIGLKLKLVADKW
jgi:hypothetical protein